MTNLEGKLNIQGTLRYRIIRPPRASLAWRLHNTLRWGYIWGYLTTFLARRFSGLTGVMTLTSELKARVWHEGQCTDYGVLSRRVITDAGVAFLIDDWDNNATDITNMNWHACGTGVGGELPGDIALGTEVVWAARAAGVKSQPAANQLRTIATQAIVAPGGAVTEHGLFSANAAGTLWDRSVFAALNVINGDSIEWTYTCTANSGG